MKEFTRPLLSAFLGVTALMAVSCESTPAPIVVLPPAPSAPPKTIKVPETKIVYVPAPAPQPPPPPARNPDGFEAVRPSSGTPAGKIANSPDVDRDQQSKEQKFEASKAAGSGVKGN